MSPPPPGDRLSRAAFVILTAYALVLAWVSLRLHQTPFYNVETDLLGDYIPAARDLLAGTMQAGHYVYKGFGYPLALALSGWLTRGDYYLAARLLNVAAAVAGAACSFLLFRAFLGPAAGLAVLLGLCANPVYSRTAIEAGTDLPTFALMIAATHLVIYRRSRRVLALAGFLAGYAVITRYNAAFLALAAAAVLMARRRGRGDLWAYAGGFAVPVGAWMITNFALTGSPFTNRNYLDVAAEVYGLRMGWDAFWRLVAPRFHSLWDVIRYDPRAFAWRMGSNLAGHWWQDIRELLPVAMGVLAIPGMALCWAGHRGWRAMLLHFLLCYLTLVQIFYEPRFFLYLVPFYLGGSAAILLGPWPALFGRRGSGSGPLHDRWEHPVGWILLGGLILASGLTSVANVRSLLADAPEEVRIGGRLLRAQAPAGGRILARKPHVAYFAGMDYVPIPPVQRMVELLSAGRDMQAGYLFYSPLEERLCPQFQVLSCEGLELPGLQQLAYRSLGPDHFLALYRLTGEIPGTAVMSAAELRALGRIAELHPDDARTRMVLASRLLDAGQNREALLQLSVTERLMPGDPRVAAFAAMAHRELGELEPAALACETCIARGHGTAVLYDMLGRIRMEQGMAAAARDQFQQAVKRQPASVDFVNDLAGAWLGLGKYEQAAEAFERCLSLEAGSEPARLLAARCHALAGRKERALELLNQAGRTGGAVSAPVAALADSLRGGVR